MRRLWRTNIDLLIVSGLPLALAVACQVPIRPLRIAFGLLCLCFLPGYALLAALFPRRDGLRSAERTALSFGLSAAIVPLIGLLLNYTPWGLGLGLILVVLTMFILACCMVAHIRRGRLSSWLRYAPRIDLDVHGWKSWDGVSVFLGVVLFLAVGASVAALAYAVAVPRAGEPFTEFYLLRAGGMAEGYPQEVAAGEPLTVRIGVVNHEHGALAYHVERVGDAGVEHVVSPQIAQGEGWEQEIAFTLDEPGEDRLVTFHLYKGDDPTPYRSLQLWIQVREIP